MEVNSIIIWLILIIIYFVSIPLARLANKFAYQKENFAIEPWTWYVVGANTLITIILPIATLIFMLIRRIKPVSYYKAKWYIYKKD